MLNKKQLNIFSIRKFKAGVASVLIASAFLLFAGGNNALAQMENMPVANSEVAMPMNENQPNMKESTKEDIKMAVEKNIKAETEVPAAYLEKAKEDGTGPFLAGVNNVIPFEAFGGDGMLTRLLLEKSKDVAWSDNGADMNDAIAPLENLKDMEYFYTVSLEGTDGKVGKELLNKLKDNGTRTYNADVNVFGKIGDKADESNVIASRKIKVTINGLTPTSDVIKAVEENINEETEVPTYYVENADSEAMGPFLAGVNNTIPFEAFGGDGMLTRLLLMAAKDAPWSDNGVDMNAPILPLSTLTNGQYFYKVSLDGVAAGKTGKELLEALKAAGMNSYTATVEVFGNKNGKADETNVIASRKVTLKVNMKMLEKMNIQGEMSMSEEMKMKDGMVMSDKMTMQDEMKMPDKMDKKLTKTGSTTSNSLGIVSFILTILAGLGLHKKFKIKM
ncbi:SSURE domain-containing protein [Gemella sp. zg-1178]|uniref:SSURE domain-containing protein n=1 Tax=Gemella sp. zg-1178 TaxID=2840372 RepID=UPI001C05CADC|nr:fibronectin-binding SSURE repeat-containing protein [Gemella sp. zg-1178]MBU0279325.1 fibronectin-binding SSURE repeat-containing protein [Gemella sp. zg-1178]